MDGPAAPGARLAASMRRRAVACATEKRAAFPYPDEAGDPSDMVRTSATLFGAHGDLSSAPDSLAVEGNQDGGQS